MHLPHKSGTVQRTFSRLARDSRAFVALLIAVMSAGSVATAQTPQPLTIRVAASVNADVAPLIYAVQKGLFTNAGINADFMPMATGAAISQGVVGGSIDIGFANTPALIAGHARGVPFLLIAPAGAYDTNNPATVMVVRKDAPFSSGRDFAGKTIGVPTLKDLDALATASWVDAHGGNSDSLRYVELPNPALLPALLEGRIDGFTLGEPWVTQALASGQTRLFAKSLDAIGLHFITTGWFSTAPFIDAHRDAVIRFERVLQDATIYANAHVTEMTPYMAMFSKLDPAMIARTMRFQHPTVLDPKLIQPMIDVSVRLHVIPKSFDARELISPTALVAR
jgi:ABC-type nitrate/sulfonate/bicarbonate transport system substrate-binding protein